MPKTFDPQTLSANYTLTIPQLDLILKGLRKLELGEAVDLFLQINMAMNQAVAAGRAQFEAENAVPDTAS